MRQSDLRYDLPPDRIAQSPAEPRDAARLLVLQRGAARIDHRRFRDLPTLIRPGDCLVRNNTRVLPARVRLRRAGGRRVEMLFLREEGAAWRVLLRPAGRLRVGERLVPELADTGGTGGMAVTGGMASREAGSHAVMGGMASREAGSHAGRMRGDPAQAEHAHAEDGESMPPDRARQALGAHAHTEDGESMPPDGESMPPDGESVPPAECAAKLAEECVIELLERLERGEWLVRAFRGAAPRGASQSCTGAAPSAPNGAVDAASFLERYGETPLPPYIARPGGPGAADRERYQTVYASRPGAVAAPTAGLHFTSELLERLSAAGVRQAEVTLHVGLGTFSPIEAEDLRDHHMHAEWYDAPAGALAEADSARRAGGRIVAVGTTSARVLESLPVELGREPPPAASLSGWTDLFIYPPYGFRNVDALLTNFHLPGSTLLAMVMAFAGVDGVRAAYREAIEQGYRFYSYGDAMLVL